MVYYTLSIIKMNIEQALSNIPINETIKSFRGEEISSTKAMGFCAIMAKKILDLNIDSFDNSTVHVLCFVDESNQTMLHFKDTKFEHHVFLYDSDKIIDPLLGRNFPDIDTYLYFYSTTRRYT